MSEHIPVGTDAAYVQAVAASAVDAIELLEAERDALAAELAQAREALERIAEQQQKTLKTIESNGFVFEDIGHEPGNWQHLAFTIYTDLCEVDTIARAALSGGADE